jgi:hypothetical protein
MIEEGYQVGICCRGGRWTEWMEDLENVGMAMVAGEQFKMNMEVAVMTMFISSLKIASLQLDKLFLTWEKTTNK